MCTINKSAHTKKSLETYRMHLVQEVASLKNRNSFTLWKLAGISVLRTKKTSFLKKFKISFIVHFYFGKYSSILNPFLYTSDYLSQSWQVTLQALVLARSPMLSSKNLLHCLHVSWLVVLYGISTLIGYLMTVLFIHIYQIYMICKLILSR